MTDAVLGRWQLPRGFRLARRAGRNSAAVRPAVLPPQVEGPPKNITVVRSVLAGPRLASQAMLAEGAFGVVMRRDDDQVLLGHREAGVWHLVVENRSRQLKALCARLREPCGCRYCASGSQPQISLHRRGRRRSLEISTGCPIRVHRVAVALMGDGFQTEIQRCAVATVAQTGRPDEVVIVPQAGIDARPVALRVAKEDILRLTLQRG